MAVVAGGAAAATAIAGIGIGASKSLPGEAFYGVKRATENVQLALTSGQEAKGKRHLEFAQTRLREVEALVGHNSALTAVLPGGVGALGALSDEAKASTIISTLQDMDAQTRAGAHDLLVVAVTDDSSEALQALNTFTVSQFNGLRDVLAALPTAAQPRATQSLSLLTVVAKQSADIARANQGGAGTGSSGGSTEAPTPSTPTPSRTANPTPTQTGAPLPTPDATPSQGTLPSAGTNVPTQVPTIPPLPTLLPLPTSIPTLPSLQPLHLP